MLWQSSLWAAPVPQRQPVLKRGMLSFCWDTSRLQDAYGCDIAGRMPGIASLPPLHGQTAVIPAAAGAGHRLQEVRHPSLCRLVPWASVLVAPGLVLVLGVSLLSGS